MLTALNRIQDLENAEKQKAGITLSEDKRTELKSLRQEVKTLRVEKEILKKASAFFAKEKK